MSRDVTKAEIGPGKPADLVGGVATYRAAVGADGHLICGIPGKTGKPCKQRAGYGTDHPGFGACKHHTGSIAVGGVAAARQEALAYVDRLKQLGIVDELVSPDDALMQEVARSQAAVEYFDGKVEEMTRDAAADPTTATNTKLIWHWNEQRRILANVSRLVVQAGIARRSIEIQEIQAAAVLAALLGVIGSPELGLEPEQIDSAKRQMAAKLRELSTAPEQREQMQAIIDV